ncbi:hypothetical protein PDESU_06140 [Pontiella desulfatans]|uniref:Uncharacterized protein n=1 Tax=Pontiella desulfatans TaxID=2750659 RepID=A0A6C2UCG5_PONDE|nr:hypothetical protein [Pontiella desulfatans]VGO17543.1 hypothetical protein PDESU_06140 [Pontiella desulfatans]
MATKLNLPEVDFVDDYREESTRIPLVITLLLLLLTAAPMSYWIFRINQVGTVSTDVSNYDVLVNAVANNVKTVDAMLNNDAEALAAINANSKKQVVTLIVPEVVIVEDRGMEPKEQRALEIELEGIYWSPANPLVGINGETYRMGDSIQGYEIVRIGKTAVQFQGADGNIVVMDMYENLLKAGKK